MLAQSDGNITELLASPGVARAGFGFPRADFGFSGGSARRPLIISFSDAGAKTGPAMAEDLNIMSRVFTKSLREKLNQETPTAMGIELLSFGNMPAQTFYLEDYGAVFFLNVNFPLVPPPPVEEKTTSGEPEDTTWEQARRELYGSRQGFGELEKRFLAEGSLSLHGPYAKGRPAEEYSAEKVEKLKEAVIQALKNGAHIRHLKPEEWLTVVISGAGEERTKKVKLQDGITPEGRIFSVNAVGYVTTRGEAATMMTMRAKKSDIDAYAAGKIDRQQFEKKVGISVY